MRISELENKLRKHAETTKNTIATPFDLKEEIKDTEVRAMNKPKNIMRRTVAVVAVLVLGIITVTMTPFANSMKGFFKDIIRFDGAITGTQYENATNDIKVNAMEVTADNADAILPLELTFENPTEAPFIYIQEIAVADYMILDSTTGEILKLESYPEYSAKGTIKDGRALVNLSINNIKLKSGEEYTIIIEKMYGLAKADAPLHTTGSWECKFVK